jgi:hypothetical protein
MVKERKRNNNDKTVSKKESFFDLSNLIPSNLELTIKIQDEDKEMLLEKLEETKNDMLHNWRIVQIIMATGIILSVVGRFYP